MRLTVLTFALAILSFSSFSYSNDNLSLFCGTYDCVAKCHIKELMQLNPDKITDEDIPAADEDRKTFYDVLRRDYQRELFAIKNDEKIHEHRVESFEKLFDLSAGQRDASWSELFWYDDLEEAREEASRTDKPILSLRMLGKLTDEFSCANSRYFRILLYSNPDISNYLRENYVLHWETVRPVPQIEIDFGDGRKMKGTITGNSTHYILDSKGRFFDAIPGLYAPERFLEYLQEGREALAGFDGSSDEELQFLRFTYHQQVLKPEEQARILSNPFAAGGAVDPFGASQTGGFGSPVSRSSTFVEESIQKGSSQPRPFPTAMNALPLAVSKRAVELPMATAFMNQPGPGFFFGGVKPAEIHPSSIALMKAKAGTSDLLPEFEVMLEGLKQTLAQDSQYNDSFLKRRISQWVLSGEIPGDINEITEKIYDELFLTPGDDPWMGLLPANTYRGLPGEGLIVSMN